MGQSIVQLQMMGDALRSSGYKSIDSALAEIVDNSIEASAADVFIIMREDADPLTGRLGITEIGILDNGTGMEIDRLASCLGIGYTTKGDRRGMGRFGVGLPQASMHVTPRVEVYSWTTPIKKDYHVRRVWLDVNMIASGAQEEIEDPDYVQIPDIFTGYLHYKSDREYDFMQHGTLVYWKNCDNIKPKVLEKLVETLSYNLGRKFRYMIHDGSHTIKLVSYDHKGGDIDKNIQANDPLFLMEDNVALGNPDEPEKISYGHQAGFVEPIFEEFGSERYDEAKYPHGKTIVWQTYRDKITGAEKKAEIQISFSIVKEKFYGPAYIKTGDPGAKPIGKYTKGLLGVSVIRAGR